MIVMETTPRKKLSKLEAYSLIEDYFSSGELPSVYYRRVGLSDKQFYAWRQRYLRDHPSFAHRLGISLTGKSPRNASYKLSLDSSRHKSASEKTGFARIDVSDSTPTTTSAAAATSNHSFAYELCYPNGVVLRLPAGIAVSTLAELIRLY